MATLADRAVELKLTTTTWFDTSQGHPGVERQGTLDPTKNDWLSRYGTSGSMIEYNPRNWAGSHAPAGNIEAAIVYAEVFRQLGKPIEKSPNDLSDLDLIDGLTRYITDQAARLRITADSVLGQGNPIPTFPPVQPPIVPVDPNPQLPVDPTPPDPCATLRTDLALLQSALRSVNENLDTVNATLDSVRQILRRIKIPAIGGGTYAHTLRQINNILLN